MNQKKVLIIGKVPPPAGGLGIHVERLIGMLEKDKYPFQFHNLRIHQFYYLPYNILKNNIVHIHVSNSYLRFILIIISKLMLKKTIFTFHGNIGRYNKIRNIIDRMSFLLANIGIVINNESYLKVKNYKSSRMIPAFIPPLEVNSLPLEIYLKIVSFKENKRRLFCTNANGMTFDKNNNEIYGILGLIDIFKELPEFGLIISDASQAYFNYFKNNKINLPSNIILLKDIHDFVNIILISDAFIRATTTDGDSLSVKESLYYEKCTICSDAVDRPKGVILYESGNMNDLKRKIKKIYNYNSMKKYIPKSGYEQIKKLYYGK